MKTEIDWSKAPEGATHYCPETEDVMAAWFKPSGSEWLFVLDQKPTRHWRRFLEDFPGSMPVVERPADWSGEGLPPVGTVCEYRAGYTTEPANWEPCEIIAHFWSNTQMLAAYVFQSADGVKLVGQGIDKAFRPLRTPEQIAAAEREKAVQEMVGALPRFVRLSGAAEFTICGILYDAGYRKAISSQ